MRFVSMALVALCLLVPVGALADADDDDFVIAVTGVGEVTAIPDMATLSLGVQTQARTATEAMSTNSAKLAAVLENLRAAGIEERDLQTRSLSVYPDTGKSYRSGGGASGTSYIVANVLSVRVRDLSQLGRLIDVALSDGANTLGGLAFGVSEQDALQQEALRRAVANALAQAELLTEAAGARLGRVREINAALNGSPMQPMLRGAARMESAVPIAEGEMTISAVVSMRWDILEK